MNDSERTAMWARSYEAATPDYKPWALRAVWVNERQLFGAVVKKLGLTIDKLMADMEE